VSDAARFALIQRDHESWDSIALARALAAVHGTPLQDQAIVARRAWGIVADDLSKSEAQSLAKALGAQGVECAVGPTAALVDLPQAETAATIDEIPAAQPVLIALAGITLTTTVKKKEKKGPSGAQKAASTAIMATTGLPIKIGGRKRSVETTKEEQSLVFFADLHYEDPSRLVRIDAAHFDFSCLEERMLYQSQGNLKLLIGDLVEAAPEAWTNHGARILLEGRPIREMGYTDLEDLEREARWLLTLRTFGI
jgi:hypothetical protein